MTDDAQIPPPGAADDEGQRLKDLLRVASPEPRSDPFSAIYAVRRRLARGRAYRAAGLSVLVVAGLVAGLVVSASGASDHRLPTQVAARGTSGTPRLTGILTSFNGCDAYLGYVKSQALAEVGPYGLGSEPTGPIGAGGMVSQGAIGFGAAVPDLMQSAAAAAASGSTSGYSQTDDQVAGVDEPDTVKTNGQIVVTLDGSTLRVLDQQAHVLGSTQIAGDTSGGFLLSGQTALVFSASPAAAGNDPVGVNDPSFGSTTATSSPAQAQVAVVNLADPSHPRLLRTFLFDGSITAARLVDGQVRLVLESDGPRLDFVTPATTGSSATATAANRELIAQSTLGDWLPQWQVESPDGSANARQPIAACDSVARPQQPSGLSTVSVLTLDPTSAAPGPGTSIVAAGGTVYETADHVYVAGAMSTTANPYAGAEPSGCCSVLPPLQASTRIYAFALTSSGAPDFLGAGSVPGWLVNSYAMDEDSNGLLRVASTSRSADGSSQSQITELAESGGRLTTVGSVGGLGKGEFIRAVRFIGTDAYVVTYQSFDPLYVVNLSDPAHPTLAGALDQPGFSEFLYPLPDQRLLGIGVQITDGEPSGLIVATYDVADPSHPTRIDTSVLATGYQYVAQGYDPHSFVYWSPGDLALVGLPDAPTYPGALGATGGGSGIGAYQIQADGRLVRTATLQHGSDLTTRALVIDGQAWAMTDAGVVTAQLTDLAVTTWHPYG